MNPVISKFTTLFACWPWSWPVELRAAATRLTQICDVFFGFRCSSFYRSITSFAFRARPRDSL